MSRTSNPQIEPSIISRDNINLQTVTDNLNQDIRYRQIQQIQDPRQKLEALKIYKQLRETENDISDLKKQISTDKNINPFAFDKSTALSIENQVSKTLGSTPEILTPIVNGIDSRTQTLNFTPTTISDSGSAPVVNGELDLSQINYLPNVLDSYQNSTYKITLYMTEENFDNKDHSELKKVILAESGVTVGINIKNVEIENFVDHKAHGVSSTALGFKIELLEVNNCKLLDILWMSAKTLGIKNYTTCQYWLKVEFIAYDLLGLPKRRITDQGSGEWIWPIQFVDLKFHLEASGGTYNIEAKPYGEYYRTHTDVLQTKSDLNSVVVTLKDAVKALEKNLNNNELDLNLEDKDYIQYVYKLEIDEPWASAKLTVVNPDQQPDKNKNFKVEDTGKVRIQFASKTQLRRIIESLIANTELGQQLINRTKDAESGKNPKPDDIASKLFKIETSERNIGFSWYYNDYRKEIKIRIVPYSKYNIVTTSQQSELIGDKNFQETRLKKILANNLLKKRYDYIFTGKNTEIINMNLEFNMAWKASLPFYEGGTGTQWNQTTAKFNEVAYNIRDSLKFLKSKIEEKKEDLRKIQDTINKTNDQLDVLYRRNDDNEGLVINSIATKLSKLQNEFEDNKKILESREQLLSERVRQLSENRQRLQNIDNTTNQNNISKLSNSNLIYGEELEIVNPSAFMDIPLPIDFKQDTDQKDRNYKEGFEARTTRGRSLFASLYDQAINGTDLMSIDLEITGDPYWLGTPYLSWQKKLFENNEFTYYDNNDLPIYSATQHMALINIGMPEQVDITTGLVKIKNSEVLSGIYLVYKVTHKFNNGTFTQTLELQRDINTNITGIKR